MRAWMVLAVAGVCGAAGAQVPEIRPMARVDTPIPWRDGYFGRSVVAFGDLLVVTQERGEPGGVYWRGAIAGIDISDPEDPREVWSMPTPRFPRSVPGFISGYGFEMRMTDRVLAVSAPQSGASATGLGGLVHLLDPQTGWQLAEILPPTFGGDGADHLFGYAMDIEGDRLLVGMPRNSQVGFVTGAAFLYDISDPRRPVLLREFYPEPGTPNWSQFGSSVAIDGDTVVIADPQDYDDGGNRSGEVHVFDAISGERVAVLHPEAGTGWDAFATFVSIGNGIIVTNAPEDRANGSGAIGAVYAFDARSFERLSVLRPTTGSGESMGWGLEFDGVLLRNNVGSLGYPVGRSRTWDYSDPRMPVRIASHMHVDAELVPGLAQPDVWVAGISSFDGVVQNQGAVLIFPAGPCSKADLAGPYEVLNMFDIAEYIDAWRSGDAMRADLAMPVGVLDFRDVQAYLDAYVAGCPGE